MESIAQEALKSNRSDTSFRHRIGSLIGGGVKPFVLADVLRHVCSRLCALELSLFVMTGVQLRVIIPACPLLVHGCSLPRNPGP